MVVIDTFGTPIVKPLDRIFASFAFNRKFGSSREGFKGEIMIRVRRVGDIFGHVEAGLMKVKTT